MTYADGAGELTAKLLKLGHGIIPDLTRNDPSGYIRPLF